MLSLLYKDMSLINIEILFQDRENKTLVFNPSKFVCISKFS